MDRVKCVISHANASRQRRGRRACGRPVVPLKGRTASAPVFIAAVADQVDQHDGFLRRTRALGGIHGMQVGLNVGSAAAWSV